MCSCAVCVEHLASIEWLGNNSGVMLIEKINNCFTLGIVDE